MVSSNTLLGIQYHGAKGAGFRIHWIEPLSANLVETIIQTVLELTKEYREHLHYIRSKIVQISYQNQLMILIKIMWK